MPGRRGQGRAQQERTPGRPERQNTPGSSGTPQTTPNQQRPGSNRGRRGRGPGRGSNTTPFAANRTPDGNNRSQGSAGRGTGTFNYPGRDATADAANAGPSGYSRGSAAVCSEDRMLLLVGRDAKMPRVWELRVHPSQRFSTAWLAAIDRWAQTIVSGSSANQQQQPPPPPRPQGAAAKAGGSTAAVDPPIPADAPEIDNDDYDSSNFDSDGGLEDCHYDAAAAVADDEIDANSGASDNDVYDMVSYLKKMNITNDLSGQAEHGSATAEPDLDAVSCAATAGSSITGRRSRRRAAKSLAAAAAGEGMDEDSAAELAECDASDSTRSWETDSEAAGEDLELQQQQQQQSGAAAAEQNERSSSSSSDGGDERSGFDSPGAGSTSSDTAYDLAVTAAEEQDLLCEAGPKLQQQSVPSSSQGAGSSAAAAAGTDEGRKRRVRRGERKREKRQQQLLVSLRLERQGLTDREVQQLATWFTSSPSAQHMSLSKLWLFDNSLGDAAAVALAALIGPNTTELHLSHNQIGVEGAKALLAAVPLQRAKGLKPLWFRIEWNQIDQRELRRFIEEECVARGLIVDIAEEVPISERPNRTDSKGRELNLSWNKPWQDVHVQMPWLSCQRAPPAEAEVLKAAKMVWSSRRQTNGSATSAPTGPTAAGVGSSGGCSISRSSDRSAGVVSGTQQQQQQGSMPFGSGSRYGGVVAAAALLDGRAHQTTPLVHEPPPPPPRAAPSTLAAAAIPSPAAAASPAVPPVQYQDGPLMLFVDTSAFLAMLGCGGSVASNTCFTMKLLQALAGSGRFGRGLPAEQQTFIVLADTVLKQLDSFKSGEAGVAGPVRRFLDKGLDEVGPKGLDFLTVLAAHEGEGLVVDRQAAVAGSRSPLFSGTTGQRSDLSIIEVGLFFRKELLAAASTELAEAGVRHEQSGLEAQPVILITNDNGQLQLAKAHGLPAFKLAGATELESQLTTIIKCGSDLSSSTLRTLLAPSATAGLGAVAGRSLQDDFDGSVSCLRGLLEAYQDYSGLLGRVSMLVAGSSPGDEAAVVSDLRQLLQDHQHTQLTPETGDELETAVGGTAAAANGAGGALSVLDAGLANICALERCLLSWEGRAAKHHTPSRVLKWAGAAVGRGSVDGL